MKKLYYIILPVVLFSCSGDMADESAVYNSDGTGSSLARMTIKDNFLYVVNDNSLYSFDITKPEIPAESNYISIASGIETIYPYYDNLLIGSNNAMYIFSIAEDPSTPEYLSEFRHWVSCDPVVAQNDYAYITLRSGSGCNPVALNEVQVVNISDRFNPFQVASVPLQNPHGLAVKDNVLLVCEGTNGLVWLDISDPTQPRIDSVYTGFHAYDVIVKNNLAIVTGNDGYFQYDISEGYLKKLGEITYL